MSWIPSYKKPQSSVYTPPLWSTGTDAEIVEALEKHYAGEVDLTEYWSVGDERVISLGAMSETTNYNYNAPYTDGEPARNTTLVILNVGGKELVTPINGHTECAFVVGFKDVIEDRSGHGTLNGDGWTQSYIKSVWIPDKLIPAIPNETLSFFKYFKVLSASSYNYGIGAVTEELFTIPAERELTGTTISSYAGPKTAEASLTQFDYYKTSANIVKKYTTYAKNYWTRSVINNSSYPVFAYITASGSTGSKETSYSATSGLSPYGVI